MLTIRLMVFFQDGGTSSISHPTHPLALAAGAGFQMGGSMHSMKSGAISLDGSEAVLPETQVKKPPTGRPSAR